MVKNYDTIGKKDENSDMNSEKREGVL